MNQVIKDWLINSGKALIDQRFEKLKSTISGKETVDDIFIKLTEFELNDSDTIDKKASVIYDYLLLQAAYSGHHLMQLFVVDKYHIKDLRISKLMFDLSEKNETIKKIKEKLQCQEYTTIWPGTSQFSDLMNNLNIKFQD